MFLPYKLIIKFEKNIFFELEFYQRCNALGIRKFCRPIKFKIKSKKGESEKSARSWAQILLKSDFSRYQISWSPISKNNSSF